MYASRQGVGFYRNSGSSKPAGTTIIQNTVVWHTLYGYISKHSLEIVIPHYEAIAKIAARELDWSEHQEADELNALRRYSDSFRVAE